MTNAEKQFDVLVVGGGSAGMAAAVSAAECELLISLRLVYCARKHLKGAAI